MRRGRANIRKKTVSAFEDDDADISNNSEPIQSKVAQKPQQLSFVNEDEDEDVCL